MSRGGYRPGSGRKQGALTKKTAELAQKAADEGITPIEVALADMRFWHEMVQSLTEDHRIAIKKLVDNLRNDIVDPEQVKAVKEMTAIRQMAISSALAAAPYIHPRLAALEVEGPRAEPSMRLADPSLVSGLLKQRV